MDKFKLVIVGAQGVGKTSLVNSYLQKKFQITLKSTESV